uniref:Uncharacterized protein n=1 Tax=Poecilia latipinna TaxID=48699 RepID=A0A3B3V2A5_9TELE
WWLLVLQLADFMRYKTQCIFNFNRTLLPEVSVCSSSLYFCHLKIFRKKQCFQEIFFSSLKFQKNCPACEIYSLENSKVFYNRLLNILQKINFHRICSF